MKNWLVSHHEKYNLNHVIWRGVIYSPKGDWTGHAQPGCGGPHPRVTFCHYDHVHVAVNS